MSCSFLSRSCHMSTFFFTLFIISSPFVYSAFINMLWPILFQLISCLSVFLLITLIIYHFSCSPSISYLFYFIILFILPYYQSFFLLTFHFLSVSYLSLFCQFLTYNFLLVSYVFYALFSPPTCSLSVTLIDFLCIPQCLPYLSYQSYIYRFPIILCCSQFLIYQITDHFSYNFSSPYFFFLLPCALAPPIPFF